MGKSEWGSDVIPVERPPAGPLLLIVTTESSYIQVSTRVDVVQMSSIHS